MANLVETLLDSMTNGDYSEEKYQPVDLMTDIILWCIDNNLDYDEYIRTAKNHAKTESSEKT